MITEEYLKDNFITAHFIDNERQNIEILSTTEDKKQTISNIIEYNEEHPAFKALLTKVSVDQLHEYTYQKVKNERKVFEETVLKIAKKDGIIMDSAKIDTKFYPKVVDALFNDEENPDHLFALKLAVFEIDKVKDSKKEDLKKKLRQSKSKLEVISTVCEILS
jgi:hypothetical protein